MVRSKGIVVEIAQNNKVIVMTSQGEFIKVPFKKHVHVGQEINYVRKNKHVGVLRMGLAATFFLVFLGTWPILTNLLVAPALKTAYVLTLDLKSSLELQVSDDQRIVTIEGLNQEGKELASGLNFAGKDLDFVLKEIVEYARKSQLGPEQVMVTIASHGGQNIAVKELKNSGDGLFAELEQTVFEAFKNNKFAQVRVWQVPLSLQTEAKFAGLAPSRYVSLRAPIDRVLPSGAETRLTVLDVAEQSKEYKTVTRSTPNLTQAKMARPALTPVQWTRQNTNSSQRTDVTNVNFPIMTSKGDFGLYR
ncbi:MAG TPA: anti-sigma factor domain-containing protein [Natronincola sp.]|nr:anti-sigma factor domain-containing protein [Natronincola sp.]